VELGVFIDHPAHRLRVGAHVRGGNVGVRADEIVDFLHESASQALQLAGAERARVAGDAALGSAVGKVHHRRFPGHQRSESVDLVGVDLGMVANTTLHGAPRVVVLHPESGERGDGTIVAEESALHLDFAIRRNELLRYALVEAEQPGRFVEIQIGCFGRLHIH
jgi:hypothetical protein